MSIHTITARLTRMDELIIENTKPPVTAQLRNQVWLIIQDMEAMAQSLDRIESNVKGIQKDFSEYADLKAQLAALKEKYRNAQG
jgi:hypothetical protein